MLTTESIATKWNASLYDKQHDFVYKYGEDLVALLDPQAGERILDMGCGTGYLTSAIAASGAIVKGIDNAAAMIEKAKASYPAIDFQLASVIDYNEPEKYDAIFSNAVLHWVKEKELAAEKMYQHLKNNGRLVLEMGGHRNIAGILQALTSTLALFGYVEQANIEQWYFPTLSSYTGILEQAGFRVVYATHFDRETPLKDTEQGLEDWLEMFAHNYLKEINTKDKAIILRNVRKNLEQTHYRNGIWYADYKRLRIVAIKETHY